MFGLVPVINATGIILHTGLGRAPLATEAIEEMVAVARDYASVEIDLESCRITAHLPDGDVTETFDVPEGSRRMLLEGLDEIGLTLQCADAIAAYEARHPELVPA